MKYNFDKKPAGTIHSCRFFYFLNILIGCEPTALKRPGFRNVSHLHAPMAQQVLSVGSYPWATTGSITILTRRFMALSDDISCDSP